MLTLIIGISLGLVLLFAILLFFTEVIGTYPVWKHFHYPSLSSIHRILSKQKDGKSRKFLLWVPASLLIVCFVAFLVASASRRMPMAKKEITAVQVPNTKRVKTLFDSLSIPGLFIKSETKWEDGKLYCNSTVFLENPQPFFFEDLQLSFLDKDGFLIKGLHFTTNDFITATNAYGIASLFNRCNTPMSLIEYGRIERVQIVVDRKAIH